MDSNFFSSQLDINTITSWSEIIPFAKAQINGIQLINLLDNPIIEQLKNNNVNITTINTMKVQFRFIEYVEGYTSLEFKFYRQSDVDYVDPICMSFRNNTEASSNGKKQII